MNFEESDSSTHAVARARTHGCPERLIESVCEQAAVDAVEDAEEDGGDGVHVHWGCAWSVVCSTQRGPQHASDGVTTHA